MPVPTVEEKVERLSGEENYKCGALYSAEEIFDLGLFALVLERRFLG